jgi:hypothetical protein
MSHVIAGIKSSVQLRQFRATDPAYRNDFLILMQMWPAASFKNKPLGVGLACARVRKIKKIYVLAMS